MSKEEFKFIGLFFMVLPIPLWILFGLHNKELVIFVVTLVSLFFVPPIIKKLLV